MTSTNPCSAAAVDTHANKSSACQLITTERTNDRVRVRLVAAPDAGPARGSYGGGQPPIGAVDRVERGPRPPCRRSPGPTRTAAERPGAPAQPVTTWGEQHLTLDGDFVVMTESSSSAFQARIPNVNVIEC